MNTKHILSLLIGVLLGSGITYLIVKSEDVESKATPISLSADKDTALDETHRTRCLIYVRKWHQLMRAYEGMDNRRRGEPFVIAEFRAFCERSDIPAPEISDCHAGHTYIWSAVVPELGIPLLRCSNPDHAPLDTTAW